MKKIINGKKYDTDTATKVDSKGNNKFVNDFNYACETLYQKKTGEYFLHIDGGYTTCFSQEKFEYVGHYEQKREFDGICPLSEEEAKMWAAEALTGDEYITIFGEVEE